MNSTKAPIISTISEKPIIIANCLMALLLSKSGDKRERASVSPRSAFLKPMLMIRVSFKTESMNAFIKSSNDYAKQGSICISPFDYYVYLNTYKLPCSENSTKPRLKLQACIIRNLDILMSFLMSHLPYHASFVA